ncbi:hypothetical protein KPL70_014523 [Citrus sinensis]|nr:hypothetical protein KPL70_014523 [Citrus sinensis]
MTNKVDLEKFTGQNDFNMWRIKMEALLITQGLGDAIDPVIKSENTEASSSRTPEQMAEIDKKARNTIILSLGDSVIREVAKEKTVAGLWAKLEQLYMKKSFANRLYIKKNMFSLRMIEGASLDEHIDECNKVCDELETIDEGLSDESKALLLISSLPKSYEHFVDALLYGRQSLSLEDVKSALGHFKRDCPERKTKQKESKDKCGNAAIATEETSFETAEVLIATKEKTQVGIGTVSLKMYDGMVKELTQVRHVPELKRNLISIGMLDQTGYVIKAKNGTLKVIRGSIVIMKGTKQNGSYVLNGHTTVGEASVTEKSEDKARLWHLRLGHMSERELKELQKNGVFGSDKLSSLGFCEDCILGKASRLKVADYSKLRIFGCVAYAHVKQGKLEPRALRCRFLGYPDGVKGYRLWCIDMKPPKCIISRDVTFNESEILNKSKTIESKDHRSKTKPGSVQFKVEFHEQDMTELETEGDSGRVTDGYDVVQESEPAENEDNSYQLVRDRKKRAIRPPKRFKAMLVARGFTQRERIDFNEIFSPVVKHASIRVILALVAIQDMYLEHMDIKTTFLHGELQEEIVMEQPEGYVVSGKEDHVCLLKKSFYGLKQSPRQWDIGDGKMIYLMMYVDDMLIACHSIDEISHLKDLLSSEFDMKDLGGKEDLRFGMHDSKFVQTPLANHFKLSTAQCPQTDAEQGKMARIPYSSAIGSLMYAMVLTRPDISHAVSIEGHKLVGYVDSDFAGDLDKRRSQTGFIFTLGGYTVNWKATLQNVVALSTIEAEYIEAAEAFKEAIWLKGMV